MTTYTGNIQTASMEATQDQKEVTFNDFRAAIDARVTERQTMSVTAIGGPSGGQGYTVRQKEDLGRSWYLVFDEAGVGPCTADWIGLFPTINGGLFIARNDTAFTATFKITGQGTPPTLVAGDWAIYSLDAIAGVILRVPSSAAAAIPLSYLDTDGTLAANSDTKVATQKATKTYVDAAKASAISTAEAYADSGDANSIKSNATSTFTAGQKGTATSLGTKSSGTLTPTVDASNMNLQYVTNGGAFTLAAPSTTGDYTIILDITNNGSAGAISYSGWTKNPSGDTLDTTNTHAFRFFITKINGVTSATVQALQ